MTKLCRFYLPEQGARLGVVVDGTVYDLTATGAPHFATLASLLQHSTTHPLPRLIEQVTLSDLPAYSYESLDRLPDSEHPHLLPPVDQQEIWAAGVTYLWSREARVREAISKDIYVRVYEAERPELFFKCLAEKAVGPNDWIGLRGDSQWNVPEPELALVLNPALEIVGYTIGNDVSSREIEGENPLYLPQAKIYRHSCAIGPLIALEDGLDARALAIQLSIHRDGNPVFEGETDTAQMHRSLEYLVGYLGRYNDFPYGAVLLTGTGIVPADDFTLQDGDEVEIAVDGAGMLRNPVKQM
ncbi:MAG: fumarylacetoacetate hydrolase family protein [Chloroflexota bacterium]|nr:fumarylacetoacetate hydrolase family protein [Chloroflexota bacterium]